MAVSAAQSLAVAGTDTDARDYTTGSFTPTANRVLIAAFEQLDLGSAKTLPTISDSSGVLTWTLINGAGGAADQPSLYTWWAYCPKGGVGAITITFSACVSAGQTADGAIWGVVELTSAYPVAPIVQNDVASATADSISVTLAAFQHVANATAAWYSGYDNGGGTMSVTAGADFTNIDNGTVLAGGTRMRLAFEFKAVNDTGVDATAQVSNDRMLMVAFEIAAARSQPSRINWRRFQPLMRRNS